MQKGFSQRAKKIMDSTELKNINAQRNYYRHETDLTATLKNEVNLIPVKIVNINVVGASLKSKEPLESGKQIELSFQLPGASRKIINCSAKVIWTAQFDGYHSEVRFIDIKRIDQYRIIGFIRNELKKKKNFGDATHAILNNDLKDKRVEVGFRVIEEKHIPK